MTSRPLFISVEESTVIFGPIDHVGWARASATVTDAKSSGRRPRNGPPDAVSTIRADFADAAPEPARRHWWMAQCSESTGMSSAPGVDRSGCTTGPAAISDSLLASARRLPARSVATVTGRPAKPVTPLTTTSASSARRAARSSTTSANGNRSATSARASGSATATTLGRQRSAWATQCVDRRPRSEPDDLVPLGISGDHIEGLRADRTRRPGDGDANAHLPMLAACTGHDTASPPSRGTGNGVDCSDPAPNGPTWATPPGPSARVVP